MPEQKQAMISKITDTMVEIEGENLRPGTWVLVEEVRSGDWDIAGNGLTNADVHALGNDLGERCFRWLEKRPPRAEAAGV